MKKNDTQLQRDVIDELRWDAQVGGAEIGVAVKAGVVTLTGQVGNYARKIAAVRAAERVGGVRVVADDVTVALPLVAKRTDTDIAHAVADALAWDIEVPDDRIKARVDDGWLWLEGNVDWQYQRTAAERVVARLTGVKGVTNLIDIRKHASVADVKQRIESAIKRQAELDSHQIRVEAADGRVTLKGRVRTWAERDDAERAAWSAPGVTAVEDEIAIGLGG